MKRTRNIINLVLVCWLLSACGPSQNLTGTSPSNNDISPLPPVNDGSAASTLTATPDIETIDQFLARCPTQDEIALVNSRLTLTFDSDPTAGTLVCSAAQGSADLTLLMERAYQAVIVMEYLKFDQPLPWTQETLFDWFTGSISGIRFRGDITYSSCCNPANVINIQTGNLAAIMTDLWIPYNPETIMPAGGIEGLTLVYVHEARHNNMATGHTCGSKDDAIADMGPWGVQYSLMQWLAYHSDPAFYRPSDTNLPAYWYRWADEYESNRFLQAGYWFCSEPTATPGPLPTVPGQGSDDVPLAPGQTGTNKLVIVSDRDGNYEIYSINMDGSGLTRLTNNPAVDTNPSYSPDGTQIIFQSLRSGTSQIHKMNSDGSSVAQLTQGEDGQNMHPVWSPDGRQILFYSDRKHLQGDLYVMNADGSNVHAITDDNYQKPWFATWSPDGVQIAYIGYPDTQKLYVMNADGSDRVVITDFGWTDDTYAIDPNWSPDGQWITFMVIRGEAPGIYLIHPDGSGMARIYEYTGPNRATTWNDGISAAAPKWTPDGRYIYFALVDWEGTTQTSSIYIMNADGSDPHLLIENANNTGWGRY